MREITIGQAHDGARMDRFLSRYLPSAGSSFIHRMLRKKNITLNGKRAAGDTRVHAGDRVTLFLSDDTIAGFQRRDSFDDAHLARYRDAYRTLRGDAGESIRVIDEDADILLVSKPPGILSQRAGKETLSVNEWLCGYLLERGQGERLLTGDFRPSVANRLDRNTGGLMVCALSLAAAQSLARLFREERGMRETSGIGRTYLAVVEGVPKESGIITQTVTQLRREVKPHTVKMRVSAQTKGQESLRYHRLFTERDGRYSLLRVDLYEGKKHQIRAQMAHAGFPVAGDVKYGARRLADKPNVLLLHSLSLSFPEAAGRMEGLSGVAGKRFTAPLSAVMAEFVRETFPDFQADGICPE